jgi:Ribbon-helix-helix protein, copG family
MYNALYMASLRTQIYLTREQRERLDLITRRDHRPLAEIIRAAVDAYLCEPQDDPEAVLEQTFGSMPNLEVPSRQEWNRYA